jgi:hypothetical protein
MNASNSEDAEKAGLRKHMDGVLVGDGPGPWPPNIKYGGETYIRFHDFIYTSKPLDKLDGEQVLAVCALRSNLSTDAQFEPNLRVRKTFNLVTSTYEPAFLLEIGPGARPLYDPRGEDFRYELADLDQGIVNRLVIEGYSAALFNNNVPLAQKANSVDLLFAIFVFQFAFNKFQVAEVVRVLGPTGLILANVYRRLPDSRRKLRNMFAKNGCEIEIVALDDGIGHDHEYWLIGPDLTNPRCAAAIDALKNR